jgi:hypothetical protein
MGVCILAFCIKLLEKCPKFLTNQAKIVMNFFSFQRTKLSLKTEEWSQGRTQGGCTRGFNVSNLMGIKRRMIDIGKKITFFFLQNV